jgi:MOSC domain-containing protein YiiM
MQILSVNIGSAQPIANGKRTGTSGIFKIPVSGAVSIRITGLTGDTIIDTENHGGVDQAVYLYGQPDYEWWKAELGRPLGAGTFGENLTIDGLVSSDYCIGDRFGMGTVLLEVTAPRIPCQTLNARMGDAQFIRRFRAAERPGLYCRVLIPGEVQHGDAVRYVPTQGERIPIVEAFQFFYERHRHDSATIRRFLAAPIDVRTRNELVIEYEAIQKP